MLSKKPNINSMSDSAAEMFLDGDNSKPRNKKSRVSDSVKFYNLPIPTKIFLEAKMICVREDVTMKEYILKAIEDANSKHGHM